MKEKTKRAVTKRTYDRNVRKYAKAAGEAFSSLIAFADKYGPASGRDEYLDELRCLIDTYGRLNCDILEWCYRSGVDAERFACDVNNSTPTK